MAPLALYLITPLYGIAVGSSLYYVPYLRDWLAVFLIIFLLFMRRKYSFLGLSMLLIVGLAFYSQVYDASMIDAYSIPELFLSALLLNTKMSSRTIQEGFNQFTKIAALWIFFVFLELILSFFIPNKYSWSPINYAFISLFILDLNQLSLVSNLIFGWALVHIYKGDKNNIYQLLVAFCSLSVCIFTYNRSAWIICLISFLYVVRYFKKSSFRMIISLSFIGVLALILAPFVGSQNSSKELNDTSSSLLRLVLMKYGIDVYSANWILGVGPSNIHFAMRTAIDSLQNSPWVKEALVLAKNTTLQSGKWNTRPHNAFLVLLMSYGVMSVPLLWTWVKGTFSILKNSKTINTIEAKIGILLITLTVHALMYPQYRLVLIVIGIKLYFSSAKDGKFILNN